MFGNVLAEANVAHLGVWHVSVDAIPSFICRMFHQSQNMFFCCAVSQAASVSLWFKQVAEETDTMLQHHNTEHS